MRQKYLVYRSCCVLMSRVWLQRSWASTCTTCVDWTSLRRPTMTTSASCSPAYWQTVAGNATGSSTGSIDSLWVSLSHVLLATNIYTASSRLVGDKHLYSVFTFCWCRAFVCPILTCFSSLDLSSVDTHSVVDIDAVSTILPTNILCLSRRHTSKAP